MPISQLNHIYIADSFTNELFLINNTVGVLLYYCTTVTHAVGVETCRSLRSCRFPWSFCGIHFKGVYCTPGSVCHPERTVNSFVGFIYKTEAELFIYFNHLNDSLFIYI
jgi:hypothetical protein